ncbi:MULTISPECIES: siphovirus Gp157 family protein [unclassified Oceanobacillus]|uniref:siphovirus Gp157 family protein n=1 Tax=unclassified Oceanobacillus TaxID=2630292 RepID=UPI001BED3B29|nr:MULTISPECIES: siphovirus Gp157 family protein [unclassified Oceanobacillus]MBT2600909.1 siphovirus Gp157 family protein [Oceanobacillus sp. ISL-74]MBT2653430.1 siphovirus Gp157 family protein [Oceanobacillus sp. ISL-73]
MSSLYDLTQDFLQVQSLIDDGGEGLRDTLESIDLAIEDKLENIGKVIRNLDGEAEMLKAEEKRLSDKRKAIEANQKRLKMYVEDQLILTGKDKVKTGIFTFAMQNNPPSLKVLDEKILPKRFFIEQEPKLDKKALKEELKSIGHDMPGVELVQGKSLRIR